MVVTLDSLLRAAPRESYRFLEDGEKTLFEFNDVRYQVPAPVALTIRAMSEHATFRARNLGDHLDEHGRLQLIRHLTDIGFLTVLQ